MARAPAHGLDVGARVVVELAGAAARTVPGVVRLQRGPTLIPSAITGPAVEVDLRPPDGVAVRIWVAALEDARLTTLGQRVRRAVVRAIERQAGLRVHDVTVIVDAIGS